MTSTPVAPDPAGTTDESISRDGERVDPALIDPAQVHTLQQLGVALSRLQVRAGRPSLRTLHERSTHDEVLLARAAPRRRPAGRWPRSWPLRSPPRSAPQLEMVIRHHVDGAAPQAARDAVNDIARDLL